MDPPKAVPEASTKPYTIIMVVVDRTITKGGEVSSIKVDKVLTDFVNSGIVCISTGGSTIPVFDVSRRRTLASSSVISPLSI